MGITYLRTIRTIMFSEFSRIWSVSQVDGRTSIYRLTKPVATWVPTAETPQQRYRIYRDCVSSKTLAASYRLTGGLYWMHWIKSSVKAQPRLLPLPPNRVTPSTPITDSFYSMLNVILSFFLKIRLYIRWVLVCRNLAMTFFRICIRENKFSYTYLNHFYTIDIAGIGDFFISRDLQI